MKLPACLCFSLVTASVPAAEPITDPIPEPIVPNGVGVQLLPFARIPDSAGQPPRLNYLTSSPDGSGRLFVNDQRGLLYSISAGGEARLYLDLAEAVPDFVYPGGQAGFSYFAFHPEFGDNGVFFTVTSVDRSSGTPDYEAKHPILDSFGGEMLASHHDVLLKWQAADPQAEVYEGAEPVEILRLEQPYGDHNIGQIAFRPGIGRDHPDYGLLFMAVGNGGGHGWPVRDSDPQDHGQDLSTPFGTHLRIDPLGSNSPNGQYGIPADNPWADAGGAELGEIWTYGHRNPHRFSWDSGTGRLYSFEIGQWFIEEINLLEAGGNYGYGDREGTWLMDQEDEFSLYPLPDDDEGFTYPVAQYAHPGILGVAGSGEGAISDGFAYRGPGMPEMRGRMIFADFAGASRFFYLESAHLGDPDYGSTPPIHELLLFDETGEQRSISEIVNGLSGLRTDVRLGLDAAGEILVTNKRNGWIHRMVSAPGASAGPPSMSDLFPTAEQVGGTLWEVPWYGVMDAVHLPWAYHERHGWQWVTPVMRGETYWLYDVELGWIYLSVPHMPWLYRDVSAAWYYDSGYGRGAERWLWSSAGNTWHQTGSLQDGAPG